MQFERARWDSRRDDEDFVSIEVSPSVEGGIFVATFRGEMAVGTSAIIHGLDEVEGRALEAGDLDTLGYRLRELSAGVFRLYNCHASVVNGNRTTPCSDGILREFAPLSRRRAEANSPKGLDLQERIATEITRGY